MQQVITGPAGEPSITMRKDAYKAIIPTHRAAWIVMLVLSMLVLALGTRVLIKQAGVEAPFAGELLAAPTEQLPALAVHAVNKGAMITLIYLLFNLAFKGLDIHRRWGIFRSSEPESHFWTALRNWKVPFLWGVGVTVVYYGLTLDGDSVKFGQAPRLLVQLPEQFVFLHSPNLYTHILYAIAGFYLIDFFDCMAHRLNHAFPALYNRFPFAHFVHHNIVFVNPMTIASSPLIHFASITAFAMYAVMLTQGLLIPVFLIHAVKIVANMISHLGCDPLPWLSRLNYRVGGWIPWIPLHHQYHHIPGVKGNFGNLTSLWDHVFGTLSPEYVTHVTTGQPEPRIARVMGNQGAAIDRLMAGKTRFNLR